MDCARSFTAQVACNTDCCGFGVQYRRVNFGIRDETLFRFAFAIGNLGTVGSLHYKTRESSRRAKILGFAISYQPSVLCR